MSAPASDTGSGDAAPALAEEDLARANLYGLISRLFYAPADPNLLAEISGGSAAGVEEGEAELLAAWRRLQEASQRASAEVVRQEYDGLFIGVGKAEVTPYLSAYAGPSPDHYLVRLREQLAVWGLGRRLSVGEVEDHISGIADIMRWLIEQGHPVAEQRAFFEEYAYPGASGFFAAAHNAASSSFFKPVAAFARCFFELEKIAFGMEETS